MRCLVIVPFLNERAHLPAFLASVAAQTHRPDRLVLVDDGSTDGSAELAGEFARRHAWATLLRRPPRAPERDRLAAAPELAAFLWALQWVGGEEEVLAKMDADLALAPRLIERILAELAADPRLGIAGTYLSVAGRDGRLRQESQPADHVRGATRFYRRACFEAIAPIPVVLGWDGADEVRARDRGWRTRTFDFAGAPSVHLRPTGAHDGRLRASARWGACAYAVGAHPAGVLAAAALQSRRRPWLVRSLAYLWGWLDARRRGVPRAPADIRQAKRAEQLARIRAALSPQPTRRRRPVGSSRSAL